MKIDGRKIANDILKCLYEQSKPDKFLAAIHIGSDPASSSFLKQKEKIAHVLNIEFHTIHLPEAVTTQTVMNEIWSLAENSNCGGIILQLPLPKHLDRDAIIASIPSQLDVDSLTGVASVLPPAAEAVRTLLKFGNIEKLNEKNVAIVGTGFLVGAPVARWFEGRAKKIQVIDKGDEFGPLKNADIVVSGVGISGLIKPDMLKPGAVGIDFGYGKKDGFIQGDFDPACESVCSWFTPTPGGTGPILVAQLFTNFYTLCKTHDR